MISKKLSLATAAVLGAMAFGLSSANAALIVNYNNGATVITDGGAGDTSAGANGTIINTTSVAGFGTAITVAQSNSPGSAVAGLLQVNSLIITNNNATASTLTIRVSDTNFTNPGGSGSPMLLTSDAGGTFTSGNIGNTATFRSFADPANAQPAAATATPLLTFTKTTPGISEPFAGTNVAFFNRGAGAYSLSNEIVVNLAAGASLQISGTTAATVVPEPATLGFAGLAAMSLIARRRRSM